MKKKQLTGYWTSKRTLWIGLGIICVAVVGFWLTGGTNGRWSCSLSSGCHVKEKTPVSDPDIAFKDGQRVSVSGKFVCLPHKDTSGPHTQECAYGVRTNDGTYYALRDTTTDYSLISKVSMGVPVIVSGTYKKELTTIYQSQGLILVDAVDKASGHNE